ncbi:putative phosphoribosylformylglycinamidine synthase II [Selenomonas ruminantium subsp. lactilytica TAM6421]|uniref:Putative phosphoribosylformylglycinamidine synthase II n=1 Tax=Selenomonas ruminantium subsp. lactilytica (strain NBRC 103574 / TAM6421) TaxID=927704 RepID=I0GPI5_SELRL|nr:phosphoribosylformylglycinamidine synthase [Selenomonas ruminantium]BAL82672.1 putative phosphoribosylformylglycinamidine synthase II [Selenomonas ruminantium subsp. lactilytica TAM6421]
MTVRRIFVEKRQGYFDIPAQQLCDDLRETFRLDELKAVRIIKRYDIEGLSDEEYAAVKNVVFSEPPVDVVYEEKLPKFTNSRVFAVEFLPGQYDQTADSAAQCVQLITQKERPEIRVAKVIVIVGDIDLETFAKIKEYCINKVESREASLAKPETLVSEYEEPADVEVLETFNDLDAEGLQDFWRQHGFAMSLADMAFCQIYFRDTEKRPPTITELRVIDTYWSDHCRHTTFTTAVDDVQIDEGYYSPSLSKAYAKYMNYRDMLYIGEERDVTLMDIAVIGMKALRRQGKLEDLDKSEEINACSIVVEADIDGKPEEWLVMFKNETHNHPTEIEPFGGAATCLGGAIRDPLSGRSYVYQAMRVTGAADPRRLLKDTLPGKLPQKKITLGAAAGYSAYGNQIGLATGQVREVYHEGYMAKRMEIGAVIAAAPKENVVRERPLAGDIVVLVGGRTGRDGCGGATGSSKEHTEESLTSCGAEVQKGNPPTERKIQRLFRNPEVSRMIKRCNDFGAGGVAVAIGELAPGLTINLDAVKKKYKGLDGTELAISESQERMAVVIRPEHLERFAKLADAENLEATKVAEITQEPRLIMKWRGKAIVQMDRKFLDTNGVRQHVKARITCPDEKQRYLREIPQALQDDKADLEQLWLKNLQDLNVCSQKGLAERFDSTIGGNTVLMPFGGKRQLTPAEGMVAKLPVEGAETNTATAMTFGLNPALTEWSPFHGALYAVVEAAAKMVALGGRADKIRLTFQEYFESLGKDEVKWGKPFAALLGALWAQHELEIPAIGGKDSMSGTFEDIHVPPTLAAFAVDVLKADDAVSPEFKYPGNKVFLVPAPKDAQDLPNFPKMRANWSMVTDLMEKHRVFAAQSIGVGGIAAAVSKMVLGNGVGFKFTKSMSKSKLFTPDYGALLLEVPASEKLAEVLQQAGCQEIGETTDGPSVVCDDTVVMLADIETAYTKPLEKIFPTQVKQYSKEKAGDMTYTKGNVIKNQIKIAKPKVFIPVFPGTNCEYDSARAWERAGAEAETLVVRNLTPHAVEESVEAIVKGIKDANIIMLPGGFSGGDEPDGSGKFIAAMFRNPRIKEEVHKLLFKRDGLMLGICNGFQALIKLGLVPYGEIRDLVDSSPTLTYNNIGRHVSCMVKTKVVSNLSPWFNNVNVGDIHTIAVSHGEGRFVADKEVLANMRVRGQIATQYVDEQGNPSLFIPYNPNGSVSAVEGITSPDGRVLGKMGHSERIGQDIARNVPGEKDQQLFEAGVAYYS